MVVDGDAPLQLEVAEGAMVVGCDAASPVDVARGFVGVICGKPSPSDRAVGVMVMNYGQTQQVQQPLCSSESLGRSRRNIARIVVEPLAVDQRQRDICGSLEVGGDSECRDGAAG